MSCSLYLLYHFIGSKRLNEWKLHLAYNLILYFILFWIFFCSFPNYFFLINYSLSRRILKYYAYYFDGMLYLLDLIFKNAYNSDDSEVFHWFWIWLQPICIISGWFLFSVSNKVLYKFIVFLFVVFFFFGIDRMLFVRLFEKTFFWHRRWWRASDYDNV